eukprot:7733023-Ditylum_brightwellii.AAC.1
MVHPCKCTLVGVDENNICCLTPQGNSAITEGTMLFHGVKDSADGGDKHLTHLTQAIDCHLTSRKEQHTGGPNTTKSRSVLYHGMKSTDGKEDYDGVDECVDGCFDGHVDGHVDCCVGKEDGVEDNADGGDKHLTHLTHIESNDCVGGCKNFTHIVKNNSESLISDVTDHVTHVNFFGMMPVSKNVSFWLRGGGDLKDDWETINNDQKDNDDKNN